MIRVQLLLAVAALLWSSPLEAVEVAVLVDANRDGKVEGDADRRQSGEWSLAAGGLVLCNCDDDDGDGRRDCDDDRINGDGDRSDLAVVRVEVSPALGEHKRVTVRLDCPDGAATLFDGVGQPAEDNVWMADGKADRRELLVEATRFAGPDWDGQIKVRVDIKTKSGATATSTAVLRVAPLILRPSSAPAETVFVREFPKRNDELLARLKTATEAAGCELHVIPGDARYAYNHIWLQDAVEFGESATSTSRLTVALPSNRNREIDLFARDRLMGPGVGYVQVGEYRRPFAEGEGGVSWIDWYGNLEATPPVPGHPLGRILYGVDRGRDAQLNPEVIAMLAAQGVQEPLALDVGWLTIKHVDEMVSFIAAAAEPGKFWTLVPDTGAGLTLLERLANDGHGDAAMLRVYEKDVTVAKLLAEDGFVELNRKLQSERIDPMIAVLTRELSLDPDRVLRIPSLYRKGGLARLPSMVNCLPLGRHIAVADPDGPEVEGGDAFQAEFLRLLKPAGVTVQFVDDRQYHKWSGNVHCATNAIRAPLAAPWWEALADSPE